MLSSEVRAFSKSKNSFKKQLCKNFIAHFHSISVRIFVFWGCHVLWGRRQSQSLCGQMKASKRKNSPTCYLGECQSPHLSVDARSKIMQFLNSWILAPPVLPSSTVHWSIKAKGSANTEHPKRWHLWLICHKGNVNWLRSQKKCLPKSELP
jgi:hypothetical protein